MKNRIAWAAAALSALLLGTSARRAHAQEHKGLLQDKLTPGQSSPTQNNQPQSGCVGADCPITISHPQPGAGTGPAPSTPYPPAGGCPAATPNWNTSSGQCVACPAATPVWNAAGSLCLAATGGAQAAGTGFTAAFQSLSSAQFGFPFDNSFMSSPINIPPLNGWKTSGLCGGMVYSALDQMNGVKVPAWSSSKLPPPGSPLYQYLYNRQLDQLENDSGSLLLPITDAAGYFQQGLGANFQTVMAMINKSQPVPLGLRQAGADWTGHTVLAIGYSQAAVSIPNVGNVSNVIYLYNPNFHEVVSILYPNTQTNKWVVDTADGNPSNSETFAGYFVDASYSAKDGFNLVNLLNDVLTGLAGGAKAPPPSSTKGGPTPDKKSAPAASKAAAPTAAKTAPMRTLLSGKKLPLVL